ncbi:MAG: protocatechuate 3,4-dioxygenase [Acidimicrobiales bacterium]
MAELVLGVGSSHSPMVTMGGDDWLAWGERDLSHPMLHTRDGRHVSYEEQLAAVGDTLVAEVTAERCAEGAARVDAAVSQLRRALAEARPDVVVIVGDDQSEHLLGDNLPPFLVYWGDAITNDALADHDDRSALFARFGPGYYEPGGARTYPVATALARHLIATAADGDVDVATSNALPRSGRGMGHAFGFPVRRLVPEGAAIVPVMVNTYNPPSQPRARRCRALGAVLRHAIETYPGGERVAVVASGGLSHFIVLEDLDREVLDAFGRGDLDAVCEVPEATYVAGTSEIKNWITTAAACDGFRFELVDYVPAYRTPAGTGAGLGFALWRP